jgi:hypothetical protein
MFVIKMDDSGLTKAMLLYLRSTLLFLALLQIIPLLTPQTTAPQNCVLTSTVPRSDQRVLEGLYLAVLASYIDWFEMFQL